MQYGERSESEVGEVLNQCVESEESGASKFPGETYEAGVKACVEWMQGTGPDPMAE